MELSEVTGEDASRAASCTRCKGPFEYFGPIVQAYDKGGALDRAERRLRLVIRGFDFTLATVKFCPVLTSLPSLP